MAIRGRGSRTHGRGRKGGRGKGLIGGRGNAGSQKHERVGRVMPKRGFTSIYNPKKIINLMGINDILRVFKLDKEIPLEINLKEWGFDKLLAGGKIEFICNITVNSASRRAIESVESLGGKIIIG